MTLSSDMFREFANLSDAKFEAWVKEHAGAGRMDLEKWRLERDALRRVVLLLDGETATLLTQPGRKAKERPKGFTSAAMNILSTLSNDELMARLVKLTNHGLIRTVTYGLSTDGKTASPVPHDARGLGLLPGFLWMQAADAVRALASGRSEVECIECGSLFAPRRKGSVNRPVKFCSETCRLKHFYKRRR